MRATIYYYHLYYFSDLLVSGTKGQRRSHHSRCAAHCHSVTSCCRLLAVVLGRAHFRRRNRSSFPKHDNVVSSPSMSKSKKSQPCSSMMSRDVCHRGLLPLSSYHYLRADFLAIVGDARKKDPTNRKVR